MITLPVASIRLTVRLAKVGRSVATGDDDVPVFPLFWAEGAVEVPSKWTTIWSACITKSPLVITTVTVKCDVLSWSLKKRDSEVVKMCTEGVSECYSGWVTEHVVTDLESSS